MKLLYLSGLILVLSVCSLQPTNSEDTGSVGTTNQTGETTGEQKNEDSGSEVTPATNSTTKESANNGTDPTSETKEETGGETKTEDDSLKNLEVSTECKTGITSCLAMMKDTPTFDKADCDDIKDEKACFTNSTSGEPCSTAEYAKIKSLVCFCPRSAPSLILVGILCVLAKLLVQQ